MWVCILNWVDFGCGFRFAYLIGIDIKLGLNYEILNLGQMRFILIYYVLGLINWTYILAINLEILY